MALQKSDLTGNVLWVGSVLNELHSPHRWEYVPRTKTGKSRQIKIRQSLADRISERADGFVFLRPDREHGGRCREPYCTDEAHIRSDYFRKQVWHPVLKAIGMADSGLVPRDLRRTHATWLRANGASLEIVQQRLGHGQLTTTIGYLAEVIDAEEIAVNLIDW
jgi:integrase